MLNTELFPAQVFYLLAPKKVHVHEVFATILRDLTLRNVIRVAKINSFPNDRSKKTQKYYRFIKGEAFKGYEPQPFEKSFLIPFEETENVQTKVLTNYVLRKYSMPSGFIGDQIYNPLSKAGYIGSIPILKAFGYLSLTHKGNEVVAQANEFIHQQEEKLTALIDGDREKFIHTINETGAYIFHFEENNPALYKNIISMVKRINKSKPMGPENDLTVFMEAMNIDLSYFH
ncbi:MAG TPA: hypothetical protein DCQ26_13020 [Marinilabiliales bacterium]|nr:MAG: hypothetical protein A2W84_15695 [Bacteroidetes bacterium GWC2_40_13]OFX71988.1 MAG: hypothetical protein A2W96_08115 [Bacteroidetes bacterium GWD2_40_43]OFX89594.1 MAG: hypothetical protein A2W97_12695 [Bacteroidetes bacterium GWE2_40_63]OFY24113.1 MAG: hypothetical protein A2W88_14125 [Bacteroidetes bacterium GWF2_40_13]OFZ26304.1 MAG: hypothetical protein A2437_03045 [Bacteroidetes bacterium RIFOXYC2_FULL_40_12]HAM99523.1 hypothetical protein [Marinilabiliales bacterium]